MQAVSSIDEEDEEEDREDDEEEPEVQGQTPIPQIKQLSEDEQQSMQFLDQDYNKVKVNAPKIVAEASLFREPNR